MHGFKREVLGIVRNKIQIEKKRRGEVLSSGNLTEKAGGSDLNIGTWT